MVWVWNWEINFQFSPLPAFGDPSPTPTAVGNRCSKVGLGIFRLYLDSIVGKALRFDCGSNESGMKLQVSFSPSQKIKSSKNFAPAFPLTCFSVFVQSMKQLRSQTPLRTAIRQRNAQDVRCLKMMDRKLWALDYLNLSEQSRAERLRIQRSSHDYNERFSGKIWAFSDQNSENWQESPKPPPRGRRRMRICNS